MKIMKILQCFTEPTVEKIFEKIWSSNVKKILVKF